MCINRHMYNDVGRADENCSVSFVNITRENAPVIASSQLQTCYWQLTLDDGGAASVHRQRDVATQLLPIFVDKKICARRQRAG